MRECQATSVHKGKREGWEFYLCKKHKEVMLPLLSNKGLNAQVVKSSSGVGGN